MLIARQCSRTSKSVERCEEWISLRSNVATVFRFGNVWRVHSRFGRGATEGRRTRVAVDILCDFVEVMKAPRSHAMVSSVRVGACIGTGVWRKRKNSGRSQYAPMRFARTAMHRTRAGVRWRSHEDTFVKHAWVDDETVASPS